MNHGGKMRKFSRNTKQRKALIKNLVKSVVSCERVVTTVSKAKDIRPVVEKLVTIGKSNTLHNRRHVISFLGGNCPEVEKLFALGERFKDRNGGYLRIVKKNHRMGDCAPMALIEFVA